MARILILLSLIPLVLWLWRTDKFQHKEDAPKQPRVEQAAVDAEVSDFLRVHESEQKLYLQTTITRYRKAKKCVDLIGAVHIADANYYDELNTLFDTYDAVLFEMIGGENMTTQPRDAYTSTERQPAQVKMLRGFHGAMQKLLELESQLGGVDYQRENFVHADLTLQEFNRLQDERGESIIGFAMKHGASAPLKGQQQPSFLRILRGAFSSNADMLKMELINALGASDEMMSAVGAGDNVIIGDRNHRCIEVLEEQLQGADKLAIFYGAAHMIDMEHRLVELGFEREAERWLNAWTVDKERANAKHRGFWGF